jgi:hypothetical protein
MNNIDYFVDTKNTLMLWEIIIDEQIFKAQSNENKVKIEMLFFNNIPGFFEIERTKNMNLMNLNKKYIVLILNYLQTTFHQQRPNKTNKIKIYDEEISNKKKELISFEEIHADRKSQFDKELTKRQEEFTNELTLKIPTVPEFADQHDDKSIGKLDILLKEMTSKRNYEVEQINKNHQFTDTTQMNNWLTPQDTSVKIEKLSFLPQEKDDEFVEGRLKKNVSWEDNQEKSILNFNEIDDEETEHILFKKLKKINNSHNSHNSHNLQQPQLILPENRITNIEKELMLLNQKFDILLKTLK